MSHYPMPTTQEEAERAVRYFKRMQIFFLTGGIIVGILFEVFIRNKLPPDADSIDVRWITIFIVMGLIHAMIFIGRFSLRAVYKIFPDLSSAIFITHIGTVWRTGDIALWASVVFALSFINVVAFLAGILTAFAVPLIFRI